MGKEINSKDSFLYNCAELYKDNFLQYWTATDRLTDYVSSALLEYNNLSNLTDTHVSGNNLKRNTIDAILKKIDKNVPKEYCMHTKQEWLSSITEKDYRLCKIPKITEIYLINLNCTPKDKRPYQTKDWAPYNIIYTNLKAYLFVSPEYSIGFLVNKNLYISPIVINSKEKIYRLLNYSQDYRNSNLMYMCLGTPFFRHIHPPIKFWNNITIGKDLMSEFVPELEKRLSKRAKNILGEV